MEIDALVRAPAAFARAAGLSTPMLDHDGGARDPSGAGQGALPGLNNALATREDHAEEASACTSKARSASSPGPRAALARRSRAPMREAGARGVVVADLKTSRDRLATVAGDIDGLAVTADVGLEEDVKALIAATEAKYGPVDVFFSNAGLSRKGQEGRLRRRLGRQLAGSCHEPRVRGARAGARHARARIGLSAQHRIRGWPSGVAELDALWRDQERRRGARRASRHSIWRPRHPRFRAVPAIGADRHDDAGPERRAGRRRAAAAGSGAHGDRGDGGRTLSHSVAPAGRRIHAAQGLQPRIAG